MKERELQLHLHEYRFFPYERELAQLEVAALIGRSFTVHGGCLRMRSRWNARQLWRLTYCARYENGDGPRETLQALLERSHHAAKGSSSRRQSTRYSVHGLHEYKGKFNPQLAHALLNIFAAGPAHRVLDPFCGSGTTLVEAAHLGISATGLDMNPLAVFVANAKLAALRADVSELRTELDLTWRSLNRARATPDTGSARVQYLRRWFTPQILGDLERLRLALKERTDAASAFFLTVASDLLRDWSLQDPGDLRIRRRRGPLPSKPFLEGWREAALDRLAVLERAQPLLTRLPKHSAARIHDVRIQDGDRTRKTGFDFVVTSPPYATALPYIDTQRLSLVWLGLIEPDRIRALEADILGSREINRNRTHWEAGFEENIARLPEAAINLCRTLARSIRTSDGFRRQAVPVLLYRYLAGMRAAFTNLHGLVKRGGRMAWVVGVNQTTLGGKRFVINTPELLQEIARESGFEVDPPIALQTYQRFGLHQKNSIRTESVLLFRK